MHPEPVADHGSVRGAEAGHRNRWSRRRPKPMQPVQEETVVVETAEPAAAEKSTADTSEPPGSLTASRPRRGRACRCRLIRRGRRRHGRCGPTDDEATGGSRDVRSQGRVRCESERDAGSRQAFRSKKVETFSERSRDANRLDIERELAKLREMAYGSADEEVILEAEGRAGLGRDVLENARELVVDLKVLGNNGERSVPGVVRVKLSDKAKSPRAKLRVEIELGGDAT